MKYDFAQYDLKIFKDEKEMGILENISKSDETIISEILKKYGYSFQNRRSPWQIRSVK